MQLVREFSLAKSEGDGRRPYLNERGAFIGLHTSLLDLDAQGRWKPRPRSELDALLSAAYRGRVAVEPVAQSLATVAKALNNGDRGLAAIALVQAELPTMSDFDVALATAKLDLALLKYNPNWADEPRVPAGNSQGGQWTSDDVSTSSNSLLEDTSYVSSSSENQNSLLTDIAYQGGYHDEVVAQLADIIRKRGGTAETSVSLTSIDGTTTAVADILVQDPSNKNLYIIEVKTGADPKFTSSQSLLYPLAGIGGHVYSNSPRITSFGFERGQLLPPMTVDLIYALPNHQYFWERIIP